MRGCVPAQVGLGKLKPSLSQALAFVAPGNSQTPGCRQGGCLWLEQPRATLGYCNKQSSQGAETQTVQKQRLKLVGSVHVLILPSPEGQVKVQARMNSTWGSQASTSPPRALWEPLLGLVALDRPLSGGRNDCRRPKAWPEPHPGAQRGRHLQGCGGPSPAPLGRKGQALLSAPWWSRKLLHLPIRHRAGKSHPGGAGPPETRTSCPSPTHRSCARRVPRAHSFTEK